MRKTNHYTRGFTLIETLVAIGLFSIVVSIAAGGFVRAFRTQSQILDLIAANGNASLAIEQIAREIRTGVDFKCENDCTFLTFVNANGERVEYEKLDIEGRNAIAKRTENGDAKPVTADNVSVEYLLFYLQGELVGDEAAPRITISIGIAPAAEESNIVVTRIQTTVSARQLDE